MQNNTDLRLELNQIDSSKDVWIWPKFVPTKISRTIVQETVHTPFSQRKQCIIRLWCFINILRVACMQICSVFVSIELVGLIQKTSDTKILDNRKLNQLLERNGFLGAV